MAKIKKGDQVIVIAGKNKGTQGEVKRCYADGKITVSGVNLVKKHVRPNPQRGTDGGIQEKESPIHISNVAILNPTTKQKDRVGFRVLEDGRKVRIYKSNNENIDV